MPWPSWFWSRQDGDVSNVQISLLPANDAPPPSSGWQPFFSPEAITTTAVGIVTVLIGRQGYKRYVRRIPNVSHLKPEVFRKRSIYGYVTRVGDGDNFHLFHTPGGLWQGWGWLPGRRISQLKELKGKTIHVRIAGVDAPECAHFGRPPQPYSQEALEWLRAYALHRYVRIRPYSRDQYERVVCTAHRRTPFWFSTDVGLAMLKAGMATVYEAKFGSEFGGREAKYRAAEARAKARKVGMWHDPGIVARLFGEKKQKVETPREYKTRMAK